MFSRIQDLLSPLKLTFFSVYSISYASTQSAKKLRSRLRT
jgi:hypothetical protein